MQVPSSYVQPPNNNPQEYMYLDFKPLIILTIPYYLIYKILKM